jgi:S-adenosylmethionine:tRNA ribosyltransferase-isomerase
MIGAVSAIAPAREPRRGYRSERLLVIDPLTRRFGDYGIEELPLLFGPGDLLLVNDAATLPASLRVDENLELRLIAAEASGAFRAVAFGAGDSRVPTEERGAPRLLHVGERLQLGPELAAEVLDVDARSPRLVRLRFDSSGAAFFGALYRHAKPIQYAYAARPLELWEVQNRYASRPWAFELPSAGLPLTFETLFGLEQRGAELGYVTHAASISSTGSAELDARLPLAERYEISPATAAAIARAQQAGGRIVAVGTSVVRALEARADERGVVQPGSGEAELRLDRTYQPRLVDGLLTGLHEPGTSHFELLEAFAPRALLDRATDHAARTGYLQHEFGDSCLVLAGALLERLRA